MLNDKSSEWLNTTIKWLGKEHETPLFTPHITVGSCKGEINASDFHLFDEKFSDVNPFSIQTEKLLCNDAPYQKITVSLAPSYTIREIANSLTLLFNTETVKQDFHLSLLYGKIPCKNLEEDLKKLTTQLPNFFRVNRLWVVSINGEPKDWKLQHELLFLSD